MSKRLDQDYATATAEACTSTNLMRQLSTLSPARSSAWVIFISHPLRIKWDLAVMVLSIYNCLYLPYTLSFLDSEGVAFTVLEILIDIFFAFDIYLNLHTSFIDIKTGRLITDMKLIFKSYAMDGRLVIDSLSCIPFPLLFYSMGRSTPVSLVKLFKLIRINRLGKLIYSMRVKDYTKVIFRIFRINLILFLYLHILACTWHSLICYKQTWAPHLYARDNFYEETNVYRYMHCLYAAISSLIQFELAPSNNLEIMFCALGNIAGSLIISLIMGEFAVLVSSLNNKIGAFDRDMGSINTFMNKFRLPHSLQSEILEYFVNTYTDFMHIKDWSKVRRLIPPSRLFYINKFLHTHILKTHPLFSQSPESIEYIVRNLQIHFMVSERYLIKEGDNSDYFCLILKGNFKVWVRSLDHNLHMVRELSEGDYCGEVGLLYQKKRTASVRSLHYSSVGFLNNFVFYKVIEKWPYIHESLRSRAAFYADPYRLGILKIMRKIGYLRKLDSLSLDYLFHSLETLSFSKNSVLFEKDAISTFVYFIIQGSVSYSMNIYDSTAQKNTNDKHRTIGIEQHPRYNYTLKRSEDNSPQHSIRCTSKLARVELDNLGPGCILCGVSVLFRCQLNTHCMASSDTIVLILSIDTIEQLARQNTAFCNALNIVRKRYSHYDCMFDDIQVIPPVIDCLGNGKTIVKKLKNLVLLVIIRNRKRIDRRAVNLRALMNRVRAINIAKQSGWLQLAKALEANSLPPNYIMLFEYLYPFQMRIPICLQFAGFAKRSVELFQHLGFKFGFYTNLADQIPFSIVSLSIQENEELLVLLDKYI